MRQHWWAAAPAETSFAAPTSTSSPLATASLSARISGLGPAWWRHRRRGQRLRRPIRATQVSRPGLSPALPTGIRRLLVVDASGTIAVAATVSQARPSVVARVKTMACTGPGAMVGPVQTIVPTRAQIAARWVDVAAALTIATEQGRRVDDHDAGGANHSSVHESGEQGVS